MENSLGLKWWGIAWEQLMDSYSVNSLVRGLAQKSWGIDLGLPLAFYLVIQKDLRKEKHLRKKIFFQKITEKKNNTKDLSYLDCSLVLESENYLK